MEHLSWISYSIFLTLYMKIILLSRPNPMVESVCLCSKPFRNDGLQKMAIFHHENWNKRPIYHYFLWSASPRFLTQFYKTWCEDYTTLQTLSNGGIRVSVLRTVQKWQLTSCIFFKHISSISYSIFLKFYMQIIVFFKPYSMVTSATCVLKVKTV